MDEGELRPVGPDRLPLLSVRAGALPRPHVGHIEGLRAIGTDEEFGACLREIPPANPFLAARWREAGSDVPGLPATAAPAGAGNSGLPGWGVG